MFYKTLPPTRTSQVIPHCINFSLLVVWTSWAASEAVRQLANQACWQQKHTAVLPWLHMNACYAVVHSSHGKSSSGLLFMFTNPLIRGCRGNDEGREKKKNGLRPADELSLSTLLFLSSFSSFFALSLFFSACLGCLPFSFALITALAKLCQRAEIVLMRGPAAFASVIWWVSLGTHKTRHTRGYVTTSEPRGQPRLFLAPSC